MNAKVDVCVCGTGVGVGAGLRELLLPHPSHGNINTTSMVNMKESLRIGFFREVGLRSLQAKAGGEFVPTVQRSVVQSSRR